MNVCVCVCQHMPHFNLVDMPGHLCVIAVVFFPHIQTLSQAGCRKAISPLSDLWEVSHSHLFVIACCCRSAAGISACEARQDKAGARGLMWAAYERDCHIWRECFIGAIYEEAEPLGSSWICIFFVLDFLWHLRVKSITAYISPDFQFEKEQVTWKQRFEV